MCSPIKAILVLAVVICMSAAQLNKSRSCLCHDAANTFDPKVGIKDVTIYPATTFCNKVEIIVTTKNGSDFCLKPKAVKRMLANLTRRKVLSSKAAAAVGTSSTPGSANTTQQA
ncbi:alveolar macrophage chemotactic factor 2 [Dunckerocampus dactyliophorus]|uniref:alveolar macrophage chemotactic factor 2 n=1 Tax=Dunckerocampus dactyliophorus TaxID=161453 RepID=UPI0024051576|nr:alveolar macrophage chemotactic factor 2 [Dunckerocampus dactyliophorus]